MWSPLYSILVCEIPQFVTKSYWFRQLIILFYKVDTLRLLKIYIMLCPPTRGKYPFFWAPAHGLPMLLDQSNKTSWVFPTLKLTSVCPCDCTHQMEKAAVVKSRKVLHANLIKIALHHRYFWNNLTKVQNSNIDKHITMVIYEENYFCEHSWVAASQKQQRR